MSWRGRLWPLPAFPRELHRTRSPHPGGQRRRPTPAARGLRNLSPNFDAAGFLDSVRQKVSDCQRPVAAWGDDQKQVTVDPAPLIPDSAQIAHWSTKLASDQWVCDFSVVALANVASEIVTCSRTRSINNQAVAAARLEKIHELLGSTV